MSDNMYHKICMDATKRLYKAYIPLTAISCIATVFHIASPDALNGMYVKYGPFDIAARHFQVIACLFVLLMAAKMISWTETWSKQFNDGLPPLALTFCLVTLLLLSVMPFLVKYWALLVSLVLTSVLSMSGTCRLIACRQNGGTKATRLDRDDFTGLIGGGFACCIPVAGGFAFVHFVNGHITIPDIIICLSPLCLLVPRILMGSKMAREKKGFGDYAYVRVFSVFIFIAIAVQLGVGCLSLNSNAMATWADTVQKALQAKSAVATQPTSQPSSALVKLDEYTLNLWGFVTAIGLLGLIGYNWVFPKLEQKKNKDEGHQQLKGGE